MHMVHQHGRRVLVSWSGLVRLSMSPDLEIVAGLLEMAQLDQQLAKREVMASTCHLRSSSLDGLVQEDQSRGALVLLQQHAACTSWWPISISSRSHGIHTSSDLPEMQMKPVA